MNIKLLDATSLTLAAKAAKLCIGQQWTGDEKHVHPLQLDVIDRAITLRSNPGEVVLTPFMGVGSEAYGAVTLGRKAIGVELKESYFRQAVKNLEQAARIYDGLEKVEYEQVEMFGEDESM